MPPRAKYEMAGGRSGNTLARMPLPPVHLCLPLQSIARNRSPLETKGQGDYARGLLAQTQQGSARGEGVIRVRK